MLYLKIQSKLVHLTLLVPAEETVKLAIFRYKVRGKIDQPANFGRTIVQSPYLTHPMSYKIIFKCLKGSGWICL